ncbi:hypothetical protein C900_00014 [Fulvivirga imtechensis AK7]|uniref:DUF1704 domain-containing protein n=1 Tax=Fulvivirga imtechensis AK7 TaxID=1237149 RepID=L8JYI8_9BACT|nr:tyrosine/phenylalanine carboxypeptidase domain-containing protein [Fulvivirga imtechensis]ELR73850.1 hypothetical protein C900_00014 [Fulvivirga imtechensis AK7]
MIEQSFIQSICKSLKRGKSVNRLLPDGGKIVIDQLLPYICIYRYPADHQDVYLSGILRTQAAYILVSQDLDIRELVRCIASTVSSRFKAMMIIEMWPGKGADIEAFKVLCPSERAPATARALKEGLEEVKLDYPQLSVEVIDTKHRHPDGLPELLSIDQSKEAGSLIIGIEVPPIYISANKAYFALLYRKLRTRLSKVLKRAAFEFVRVQTANEFTHYLMMGKTRLTQLVRSADQRIAEVSERMNFLMRVTPVNDVTAWEKFKESKFQKVPSFKYRLIPLDPELEKRKLYSIELERIEDPTLAFLFRSKRKELELQLSMLEARQKQSFRHLSQSLFGEIPESTKRLAKDILSNISLANTTGAKKMKCYEFAELAKREIAIYQEKFPEIKIGVEIRHDVTGLMVSKSMLLVGDTLSINPARAEALIQHEVGTHILTYCNGKRQPIHQMYAGLDSYDQLQEGLAVLAEYFTGGLTAGRLRLLAARVLAADLMVKDADFIETFRYLKDELDFPPVSSFDITARIFRGGGFTKDAVYLRGLEQLLKFLHKGGNIETLYLGKFDLKHVSFIEELLHRTVLKKPVLPPFLKQNIVEKKLEKIRQGMSPLALLEPLQQLN